MGDGAEATPNPDAAPAAPSPAFSAADWVERMKSGSNPTGHSETSELPHADAELLDLVSQALSLEKERDEIYQGWDRTDLGPRLAAHEGKLRNILRQARKLPSLTPAGLYAKALLVKRSKSGASILALSLAEDMVNLPEVRRLIWTAEVL